MFKKKYYFTVKFSDQGMKIDHNIDENLDKAQVDNFISSLINGNMAKAAIALISENPKMSQAVAEFIQKIEPTPKFGRSALISPIAVIPTFIQQVRNSQNEQ